MLLKVDGLRPGLAPIGVADGETDSVGVFDGATAESLFPLATRRVRLHFGQAILFPRWRDSMVIEVPHKHFTNILITFRLEWSVERGDPRLNPFNQAGTYLFGNHGRVWRESHKPYSNLGLWAQVSLKIC